MKFYLKIISALRLPIFNIFLNNITRTFSAQKFQWELDLHLFRWKIARRGSDREIERQTNILNGLRERLRKILIKSLAWYIRLKCSLTSIVIPLLRVKTLGCQKINILKIFINNMMRKFEYSPYLVSYRSLLYDSNDEIVLKKYIPSKLL